MSFARNLSNKYRKQLLNTELDALKTASKKLFHKLAETTDEFLGNKITDTVAKSNNNKIVKAVEEVIIPPEKKEEILNESIQVL